MTVESNKDIDGVTAAHRAIHLQGHPGRRLDIGLRRVGLSPSSRKSAAVVGLGVYAIYLIYRGLYTLNPDALAFSLAVYLAEIHGFFSLAFYYFQIWELRRRNVPPPPEGVSVDVFITTCNEDVDLLRQTVRGAINMRYPHRTFVLDDGRRPEVRALCEELGCEYVSRDTNEHAKAGNWNHAYARTSGALIATFDADHVPRADFLERTLGFFADPWVGVVQVPQRYHNLDSLQHRVDWRQRRLYGEQDVFFNLVMPGRITGTRASSAGLAPSSVARPSRRMAVWSPAPSPRTCTRRSRCSRRGGNRST